MNCNHCPNPTDKGPNPYVANIQELAVQNHNFRTALWTGNYLQMTLMCIPPCGEIGLEIHPDTDQFIKVEQGTAVVKMGKCKSELDFQQKVYTGDAVFVPAGFWHNIINAEKTSLKVSSIYAPPHHPRGTVQATKADAEYE
jgi:mannose-6-phosphate isomerase-like protein (cupin superfamily)